MKYTNEHNGHAGDVQFYSIDKLPETATRIEQKPIALGENHNHVHIGTGDCELYEDDNILYLKTGGNKSWLQHTFENLITKDTYNSQETVEVADHKPVELMPNRIYKIGIQRKYDPFQKTWERVDD